jgi:mannose-6-phosphate isomerase-like protein (cupin superfamily)
MNGAVIIGPNEGQSLWQPAPARGHVTIKLSASNSEFQGYSAGVQVLPPGCNVREHGHRDNHELVFVFEGHGTVTVNDLTSSIEAGSTVLFEPGAYHRIDNTGPSDLKLFWVYSPPGLEDWFRAIGRERRTPDPMPPAFDRPSESAPAFERMGFLPPRSR